MLFLQCAFLKTAWERVATSSRPQSGRGEKREPRTDKAPGQNKMRSLVALFVAPRPAAAATGAFFARLGCVNGEGAAVHVRAVQCADGFSGLLIGAHRDEGKAAWTARGAIHHEVGFKHGAVRRESVLQIIFGGVEGKVSDKQFIIHLL